MALKNKKLLYIFLYLFSFGLVLGVLILVNKIEFIPIINNILLGLNFLIFLGLQIFSIFKILNFDFNKYFKIFTGIVLIGILIFSILYLFLASAFSGKEDRNLIYNADKYYVLNVGWMDPIYEVYRKNFVIMDRLSEDEIKNTFTDLNKIEDDEARDILKILIYGREGLDGKRPEEENKNQDLEEEVKENKEEVLKNFKVSDAIKIENSDLGLLEVDRAGARSHWFLVKISGDKMEFISELEETSPEVAGRMDEDGTIHLDFKDINNNKTTYISKDGGRTFEKIKSQ
ncbi:MAG: hypothetical protein E6Z55_07265 [Peptoniphilus harei]|nr:hypothetical protein [Peptoniphilus harei]